MMELERVVPKLMQEQNQEKEQVRGCEQEPCNSSHAKTTTPQQPHHAEDQTRNQSRQAVTRTEGEDRTTLLASEVKKQTQSNPKTKKKPKQSHKPRLAPEAAPPPTHLNTPRITTAVPPSSEAAFQVQQAAISELGELYQCACEGEARKYCLWTHVDVEDKRSEVMIDGGGGATSKMWEKDRWKWDEEFDPKNQGKKSGKKEVKKGVKKDVEM